ncbi:hypothetical protein HOT82_gp140 [Gordonia phage Ronaldo]|uniref:2TM domain-containing protein n=2 Tax=Ronaldovirus ronaldo TaxID=2734270 RepID=A0A6B9LKW1_9CAUD|nr:hypothetical protein HOT82_gp140 [Gordonia phage Ronaldo]AXN53693.1 hypothetical protein SEA_RONALDO_135 [Gordonia phage Ronaldo]QHB38249.1 hypothetical protein SEA_VOLT_138 [Gordonia phage Volt]
MIVAQGKWTKRIEFLTDAKRSLWIHFWFMVLWLIPGTVVTVIWLSDMVAWVSWMSLYALVVGHWSGMQAALADLRSPDAEEDSDDDS